MRLTSRWLATGALTLLAATGTGAALVVQSADAASPVKTALLANQTVSQTVTADASGVVSTTTLTCQSGYKATGSGWDIDVGVSYTPSLLSNIPVGTNQWSFLVVGLPAYASVILYVQCAAVTTG